MRQLFTRNIAFSLVVTLGVILTPAQAQDKALPRDVAVVAVNPSPAFMVRVTVDRKDRVYKGGQGNRT